MSQPAPPDRRNPTTWARLTLLGSLMALALPAARATAPQTAADPRQDPRPRQHPVLELANGLWFDGRGFRADTFYAVDGALTRRRPADIQRRIDLAGGYVVPPFGEGHNHNIEKVYNLDRQIHRYLTDGIFYVKISNNIGELARQIAGRLNTPDSIDVAFANGGLTASGGHPIKLYQEILQPKGYRGASKEWFEDRAFFVVDDEAALGRKWPAILAGDPDFLKTYLLHSEEYAQRRGDPQYFGRKGLDPGLLPKIVQRAREHGLRVSTHVETATDFHVAVAAGADEITHLPGYAIPTAEPVSRYEIAEEDARLAARRGVVVVTTVALSQLRIREPERLRRIQETQVRNLRLLHRHGVRLSAGSDHYEHTSLTEILALRRLEVFDNLTLLKLWCETTPQAVFPDRRIGRLEEGFEASFVVLGGNPLTDFEQVKNLTFRVKQGRLLALGAPGQEPSRHKGEPS